MKSEIDQCLDHAEIYADEDPSEAVKDLIRAIRLLRKENESKRRDDKS